MRSKFLRFTIFLICGYGVMKFCLKETDKFMISEIMTSRKFDPLFETRPLTIEEEAEVRKALDQPYTYFKCGGQAFVFFSADGKYVLKFFKQRHFHEPTYLNYIPFISKYREQKFFKQRKRLEADYLSYKVSFEEMAGASEVVFLHLNKTSHLNQKLSIIDKLNIVYSLNLDDVHFMLQRRGESVPTQIDKQMASNDLTGAKQTIQSVINLILERCQKGICDKDPDIATNCGILDHHAFKIDVGRFTLNDLYKNPIAYRAELLRITRPFKAWLIHHHPQLVSFLDEEILRIISGAVPAESPVPHPQTTHSHSL